MCAPNSYPLVSMMPSAVAAASEHQLGRPAAEWPQLLLAWPLPQVAALIHLESALPMAADMQGRSGFFYSCCRQPEVEALQLMELLVMRGGDPRCPDRLMQTPLFPAARHGALAACRWLLHHGVPADARDCFGQTAAYEAARLGQTAVLRLLTAAGMATDAGGPLPMPRPPVGTSALEASMAHLRGIGSVMSQGVAQGVHGQGERGGIRDESMLEPRTVASTHTALPGPLSHTADTSSPPSFSSAPALVNSADVPSGRKRYRLQYLGTAGQWLYANADKLQEFELRFPELCPWNCRQPPARIPKHDVFKKLWMPLARKMLRRVRASVPLEGQLTSTLSASDGDSTKASPLQVVAACLRDNAYDSIQEFFSAVRGAVDATGCSSPLSDELVVQQSQAQCHAALAAKADEIGLTALLRQEEVETAATARTVALLLSNGTASEVGHPLASENVHPASGDRAAMAAHGRKPPQRTTAEAEDSEDHPCSNNGGPTATDVASRNKRSVKNERPGVDAQALKSQDVGKPDTTPPPLSRRNESPLNIMQKAFPQTTKHADSNTAAAAGNVCTSWSVSAEACPAVGVLPSTFSHVADQCSPPLTFSSCVAVGEAGPDTVPSALVGLKRVKSEHHKVRKIVPQSSPPAGQAADSPVPSAATAPDNGSNGKRPHRSKKSRRLNEAGVAPVDFAGVGTSWTGEGRKDPRADVGWPGVVPPDWLGPPVVDHASLNPGDETAVGRWNMMWPGSLCGAWDAAVLPPVLPPLLPPPLCPVGPADVSTPANDSLPLLPSGYSHSMQNYATPPKTCQPQTSGVHDEPLLEAVPTHKSKLP
eukprot:GHVT01005896.1.p1 GENE.GHVT01005896.1~~GHVT01005896.1.p1  ORF type:complete len:822 (+),score=149.46 GHVT01005896.1:472-2937(+)